MRWKDKLFGTEWKQAVQYPTVSLGYSDLLEFPHCIAEDAGSGRKLFGHYTLSTFHDE
jgi:hypothetical protein